MTKQILLDRLVEKYNDIKKKISIPIIMFILSGLLTFFTWITVTIYSIDSTVKVINTEAEERGKTQDRMWQLVHDNNVILQSKVDQEINEREHKEILSKIDKLETKVDRIYNNRKLFGKNIEVDTTYIVPLKEQNLVWNTKE